MYHNKGIQLYASVYVDDILITGSSPQLVQDLITKLQSHFALKHLGKPEYFLGIEVKYLTNGSLFLTQSKYIQDLLSRAKMDTRKLSRYGTDTLQDPSHYRSIVGALQYLTLTRPEISYSANKVCQFMANPTDTH